jgi:hypothetical protein
MVVRRRGPHALELLDADRDPVDALVVHEMRHDCLSHEPPSLALSRAAASIESIGAKR